MRRQRGGRRSGTASPDGADSHPHRNSLSLPARHNSASEGTQPASGNTEPPPSRSGAVMFGQNTTINVDSEHSAPSGGVAALNITKGNRPKAAAQQPAQPTVNDDERECFALNLESLVGAGWHVAREFVHTDRYAQDLCSAERFHLVSNRRKVRTIQLRLTGMDTRYDACREVASGLAAILTDEHTQRWTLYATVPDGTCGYQILAATGALQRLKQNHPLHPQAPLTGPAEPICGLRALFTNAHLVDEADAFEAYLNPDAAQARGDVRETHETIATVTLSEWQAAAAALGLSQQQVTTLLSNANDYLLVAGLGHGAR